MSFFAQRKWLLLGIGVWLTVGWLFSPVAQGQKDDSPPRAEDSTRAEKLYYGVKACNKAGCHLSPPESAPTAKELSCRCIEGKIWKDRDKHDLAYEALTSPRGKRMGELLGYDVTKRKECLACHSVYIDKADEDKKHFTFRPEEGVNCVACHGAYSNWVDDHSGTRAPRFRALSRDQKWSQSGMKDLWDPLKRAELCASCHIGHAAEGKVITHEMYAVGHPPLPGFEPATFSNEMPRHWQYLREKSPALQKEFGLAEGELEETKQLLVGSAVSLRETMRLLQADAVSERVSKGDALDLAHFDCYACHHDLKADSWRLKRGYDKSRKPGRVGMRPWSTELIRLALSTDKSAEAQLTALDQRLLALNIAFNDRPYGDPKAVARAAKEVERLADEVALALNRRERVFKAADAEKLVNEIPKQFRTSVKLYDYDSARQIVWAYEVLRKELVRAGGKEDSPALKTIDEQLKELNTALALRLPRKADGKTLSSEYPDTLRRIAEYDPLRGQSLLKALTGR